MVWGQGGLSGKGLKVEGQFPGQRGGGEAQAGLKAPEWPEGLRVSAAGAEGEGSPRRTWPGPWEELASLQARAVGATDGPGRAALLRWSGRCGEWMVRGKSGPAQF